MSAPQGAPPPARSLSARQALPIIDPKTGKAIQPVAPTPKKPLPGRNPTAAPFNPAAVPTERNPATDELAQAIEYTMGENNFPYDFFYLSQANRFRGVPLSYVLNNPLLKRLDPDAAKVQTALAWSHVVEFRSHITDPTGLKLVRREPLPGPLAMVADRTLKNGIRKRLGPRKPPGNPEEAERVVDGLQCDLCLQTFETAGGLRHHFQSQTHQETATSDLYTLWHHEGCWQPIPEDVVDLEAAHGLARISFLTFNILFDFHHTEEIYSSQRYEAILEALRLSEVDVIGLQEVTPAFAERLMAQGWVRDHYYVSEVSLNAIQPYGQVVLSRLPISNLQLYHINKVKRALFGLIGIGGVPHAFCICHLVSNFSSALDIHTVRQVHLDTLFWELARRASDTLLLGDFNFGDDEGNYHLSPYADIWRDLRATDPGFTFDLDHNTMAKVTMKEDSVCRRYDRMLTNSSVLQPSHVELFGTIPFVAQTLEPQRGTTVQRPIHLSDHYGLFCVYDVCCPSAGFRSDGHLEGLYSSPPAPPPSGPMSFGPTHPEHSAIGVLPHPRGYGPTPAHLLFPQTSHHPYSLATSVPPPVTSPPFSHLHHTPNYSSQVAAPSTAEGPEGSPYSGY